LVIDLDRIIFARPSADAPRRDMNDNPIVFAITDRVCRPSMTLIGLLVLFAV